MASCSLFTALIFSIHSAHASLKTGISVSPNAATFNCDDFNALTSPVWWYNWGRTDLQQQLNCSNSRNIEFVPMIWGYYGGDLSDKEIPDGATTILGFNEPNIAGQAALDPAYAVQGWKALQTRFADKILVSPSASPCSGTGCYNGWTQTAWFDEFFRLCNGTCNIDYMAVHLYWCYTNNPSNNAYDWIGSLWNIYNRYGYKLWLTEFNCWAGNMTEQLYFMQQVIPKLEAADYIEKYAWFLMRSSSKRLDIQLFTNASESELSVLGEAYNAYTLSPSASPTEIPSTEPTENPSDAPSEATPNPTGAPVTRTTEPSNAPVDMPLPGNAGCKQSVHVTLLLIGFTIMVSVSV